MSNVKLAELGSEQYPDPVLPSTFNEPLWYAAYTSANHEKRVAEQLARSRVEHYLPVYKSLRRWKDRRVTLQMPLFPGYVFVCMCLRDRARVLEISGVARLVGFGGIAAPLPAGEIEALRACLSCGGTAVPHPYLTIGRRVRVKSGPLLGQQGILIRRKGKSRVVISIDLIQKSVAVDTDIADLEPMRREAPRPALATSLSLSR
jgi:transcription antitermination factor NusG